MTKLRPAGPGDGAALTDLAMRSKAHWGYDDAFLDLCRPELTMTPERIERWRTVVAERDGALVGFSSLSFDQDEPEIEMLFVEPEAIGSGAGKLLIADALQAAAERRAKSVLVEADPNAEPFYRSQGGAPAGERRSESTGRSLPLLRYTLNV